MPSAMFSATLSALNSEKCWNTMATPALRAARGSAGAKGAPFICIAPLSGFTSP